MDRSSTTPWSASIRSASVDLPWSMWAMMQKFRICAGAVKVWSAKLLMGISWSDGSCALPGYRGEAVSTQSCYAGVTYGGNMAPPWKTFQRFAENLVFNEAPKFIRHQLQQSDTLQRGIQQGIRLGLDVIAGTAPRPDAPAITSGRPVSQNFAPTAHRARRLVYAPDLDGRADP